MPTRREFLAGAAAAAAAQTPGPVNLLLITCDQWRADSAGFAGHPVVRTPAMDKLAAEGAVFTHAFSACPQCVPARATIHTGRYPHVHRTVSNLYQLPETEPTLARLLGRAGYATACVGERPFAPRDYLGGFERSLASGREHEQLLARHGWSGASIPEAHRRLLDEQKRMSAEKFQAAPAPWPDEIDETPFFARAAREFIAGQGSRPFFLHVSLRRPHHPFDPPAPYDRMYEGADFPKPHRREGEFDGKPPSQRASLATTAGFDLRKLTEADLRRIQSLYYGAITQCDRAIGGMLHELRARGLDERTLVILTADHGEMLGDHGLLFKAGYMYDEVVRVPLVMRLPGRIAADRRIDALVESADIAPTAGALLGIATPLAQGRPLLPLLQDPKARHKDAVFAEFPTTKMARTRDWKLVHYPGARHGELYDLRDDPHELVNRYADPGAAGARAEMYRRLADWSIATQEPALAPLKAEA